MNNTLRVDSLSMPLPEDILKRKWSGDLEGAIRAIDMRLEKELPELKPDFVRVRRLALLDGEGAEFR